MKNIILCSYCKQPAKDGAFCKQCERYNSTEPLLSPEEEFPEGIKGVPHDGRYSFIREWYKGLGKGALTFLLLLGLILLSISLLISPEGKEKWIIFGVGVMLLLISIPSWINKTIIDVSEIGLQVRKGPIPIPFIHSFNLRRDEIKRIELFKIIVGRIRYQLRLTKQDGKQLDILQLREREAKEAIRLYRWLSRILRI